MLVRSCIYCFPRDNPETDENPARGMNPISHQVTYLINRQMIPLAPSVQASSQLGLCLPATPVSSPHLHCWLHRGTAGAGRDGEALASFPPSVLCRSRQSRDGTPKLPQHLLRAPASAWCCLEGKSCAAIFSLEETSRLVLPSSTSTVQ